MSADDTTARLASRFALAANEFREQCASMQTCAVVYEECASILTQVRAGAAGTPEETARQLLWALERLGHLAQCITAPALLDEIRAHRGAISGLVAEATARLMP